MPARKRSVVFSTLILGSLLVIGPAARAADIDETDPMKVILKRDPTDELDRVLKQLNPKAAELAAAIRKGEEFVKKQRELIVKVQQSRPNQAPGMPSNVRFDTPAYERMRDTVCNKSDEERAHIAVAPTPKVLCQSIFHSTCYYLLSRRDQELIDRCPLVFYETSTKEWVIMMANYRIDREISKLDEARGITPKDQP